MTFSGCYFDTKMSFGDDFLFSVVKAPVCMKQLEIMNAEDNQVKHKYSYTP